CMPSATAPLDTSTTSFLRRLSSAICSAHRASAAWSRPWPSLVTRLLPTLTTRRSASAATDFIAQISYLCGRSCDLRVLGLFGPGVALQVLHDRKREFAPALACERRDNKGFLRLANLAGELRQESLDPLCAILRLDQVDLVQNHPAWLVEERFVVLAQFFDNRARVVGGIGVFVERCEIHQMQQQARTLEMAQELMPKSRTLGRTFDETGHVRDDEAAIFVHPHDPQIRVQCGKRIVRDFRPCRRHRSYISGFAGVGQAEKPHVGQDFEFQLESAAFARRARRELARRAVGAGLEMDVSQAALAALRQDRGLAVDGEIRQQFAGLDIAHHGAHGKSQGDVIGSFAIAVGTAALFTVARPVNASVAILDQRIDVAVGDREYATAAAAVTAVGPAARYEFLPPETRDAIAAVSGMDFDVGFVDEFHV